jgi:hypothetical protein
MTPAFDPLERIAFLEREVARLRKGEECHVARPGEGTYECRHDNLCAACRLRSAEARANRTSYTVGETEAALVARVRELEAERKAIAVQLQRLAPTWSHETKSWTMRQADDGPYTLWGAAAETIRATMWERDEMRRLVRELESERERLKTFAAQNFSAMIRQEAQQMREYGLSYEGVRQVLHEYNDGDISFGKLMDLIRAAARAMAEEECAALRALLVDAHRELATIEAITVSPSGVDGLIELVNRIGQKLESSK